MHLNDEITKPKFNMSIKIPTCILLLFMAFGYGQQLERQVIGTTGETISNTDVMLDFTVGETIVGDVSNTSISLSQGFHNTFVSLGIKINPVVFLQGAMLNPTAGEENLMRDDLRQLFLPIKSPYADAITCDVSVFIEGGVSGTGAIDDNIVDWVYIELRDKNNISNTLVGRSALLQRDGDIVDVDGVSNLTIETSADDYYVVIRHRNHLGIVTASPVSLSANAITVDFTNANNQITWGNNAQTTLGPSSNITTMWAGNVNGDNRIQYSGTTPDSPQILATVLNHPGNFLNFPTYTINGYNINDIDMNGKTQYSGTNPDTPIILQNTLSHPGNFLNFSTYSIIEQLPNN